MPGHTNTADPHEHGRTFRPKSGSARRTTTVVNKPRTNTNTSGSGVLRIKPDRKGSRLTETRAAKQPASVDRISNKENLNDESKNGETKQEENVLMDQDLVENNDEEMETVDENNVEATDNRKTRFTRPETPPRVETPPPAAPSPKPEVFTLETFNDKMDSFSNVFSSAKFTNVTDDYPVDEIVDVVNDVKEKIDEYKQQTLTSQRHLSALRERMHDVKERIQNNVQQKSNAIRMSEFLLSYFL